MVNDTEKAKKLLFENDALTCVLCKGDAVYKSCEKGISPMLDYIASSTDLKGFAAADKIIGKAAAMLFVKAGVKEVYGSVMSSSAAELLQKHNISCSWGTLTDKIINRKGDGVCPMEQTVAGINDLTEAYEALLRRRNELRGGIL